MDILLDVEHIILLLKPDDLEYIFSLWLPVKEQELITELHLSLLLQVPDYPWRSIWHLFLIATGSTVFILTNVVDFFHHPFTFNDWN